MENPGKKIVMLLLAGSMLVLGSCGDDKQEEFPDLAEGTYNLKIYNAEGEQVFEREGSAIGTGPDATISLTDPEFLTADSARRPGQGPAQAWSGISRTYHVIVTLLTRG